MYFLDRVAEAIVGGKSAYTFDLSRPMKTINTVNSWKLSALHTRQQLFVSTAESYLAAFLAVSHQINKTCLYVGMGETQATSLVLLL